MRAPVAAAADNASGAESRGEKTSATWPDGSGTLAALPSTSSRLHTAEAMNPVHAAALPMPDDAFLPASRLAVAASEIAVCS